MRKTSFFSTAALVALFGSVLCAGGPPEIIVHPPNPKKGYAPTVGSNSKVNPTILNHGGPVMSLTPNVYVIWYGNWNDTQKTIVTDFLNGLGGSPYFNINKTYPGVSGLLTFAGECIDASYAGSILSDPDVKTIVNNAIPNLNLGIADANGIYLVLTGDNVRKSGFCTSYCGWHTHATLSSTDIKYSFVGNPAACPANGASVGNCTAQTLKSPNGDVGIDGMISIIAHEVEEAVTDPDLNAWFDNRGAENADKCAWTFGTTTAVTDLSGTYYHNVTLGTRNYLIQRNLVRVSGGNYCVKGIVGSNLIK